MTVNREASIIQITDPDAVKLVTELETRRCCHCGQHWIYQPGSGATRGFCQRCNGFICGPDCAAYEFVPVGDCLPHEKYIEALEGLDLSKIVVGFGRPAV